MKLNFRNDGGRTVLLLEIIGQEVSEDWLEAIVNFDDKGFLAHFQISLMLNDLYTFYDQLKPLSNNLKGQAIFSTIEDNLNLVFSTDGLGHISIAGSLRHTADPDLKILFKIRTDQTLLPSLLSECNQLLKHYDPK